MKLSKIISTTITESLKIMSNDSLHPDIKSELIDAETAKAIKSIDDYYKEEKWNHSYEGCPEGYLQNLTKLYYQLVELDYHKHSDYHFSISKMWNYNLLSENHTHTIDQCEYINQVFKSQFKTYEKAQKFLYNTLKTFIEKIYLHAQNVIINNGIWNKTDLKVAKQIEDLVDKSGLFNQ